MKQNNFNILVIIVLVFLSTSLLAQNKNVQTFETPKMPIDQTTSKITYTNVVETSGDAKAVRDKALKWFHSYYKNSSNIIKKNEETILVGYPRFRILSPKSKKGVQTTAGIIEYFIKIYFKDGKYKYEITDFNWKTTSRFPIEKWLDKESPTYKESYNFYLQQTDEYVKTTIASLEKAMNTKPVVKKDDW